MKLSTTQVARVETGLKVRVDPRVVQASQILQLCVPELEQAIEVELNENPALEQLEADDEPLSENAILKQVAPQELRRTSEDHEEWRCSTHDSDDRPSWLDLASAEASLEDHLIAQLSTRLSGRMFEIGLFLIGCLNDHGYLPIEIEEVALDAQCHLEEAEAVLNILQGFDPPGIGARDLQKCLELQLANDNSAVSKAALRVIQEHMDDLVGRRMSRIARKLNLTDSQMEKVMARIQCLQPYPAFGFERSGLPVQNTRAAAVIPDITIFREESGWRVEVRGPEPNALTVNRFYREKLAELKRRPATAKEELKHVSEYVERAETFISNVAQRRLTMKRIGEYLVVKQPGFLATGKFEFLNPLTRSKMAGEIGIHESTVSRATQGKFVQIPTGEVVPFDVFFKAALRVQKMIEDILAHENPDDPLSDDAIAKLLAEKGVEVARRTVNKYRDRTKLLSSHRRRGL